jgi:putative nucleotidyltransferase with HDIG domain
MLRGIQFASRFAFSFEEHTTAAIRQHGKLLSTIESERIGEELVKLLDKSPSPSVGINLLRDFGLLFATFPELIEGVGLEQNTFHIYDVFGHNVHALDIAAELDGDLTDRLAALFHDSGKPRTVGDRPDGKGHSFHGHEIVSAEIVRQRLPALHFPSALVEDVAELAAAHMYRTDAGKDANGNLIPFSDAFLRRFIRKIGRGSEDRDLITQRLARQFALRHADRHAGKPENNNIMDNAGFERRVFSQLEKMGALTVKNLAVKGTDVIAAAIAAGVRPKHYRGDALVSQMLKALLDDVTEEPTLNDASTLRAIIAHRLTTSII